MNLLLIFIGIIFFIVIATTGSRIDLIRQTGIDEIYSVTEGDSDLTKTLIKDDYKLTNAAQKIAKSLNL